MIRAGARLALATIAALMMSGAAVPMPYLGPGLPPDSLPPSIAALRALGRTAIRIDQKSALVEAYLDSVDRAGDATGYDRALGLSVLIETRLSLQSGMDSSLYALAMDVSESMRTVLGGDHAEHARALMNLARIETWILNQPDRADSTLERAGATLERRFGAGSPELAHVLRFRADARSWAGDYSAATVLAERGIAMLESSDAPDTTVLNQLLSSLSDGLRQEGRIEEAIAVALRLDRTLLAYNPQSVRGRAINFANLGAFYFDAGQYAKAQDYLELYQRYIDSTGVGDHWTRRITLSLLGGCRLMLGDERAAEDAIAKSLEPGPGLPPELVSRTPLLVMAAQLEMYRGRWAEARRWMLESERICRLTLGADNPRCLPANSLLARCFSAEGKADSAILVARSARIGLERHGVLSVSPVLQELALAEARAHLALADTVACIQLLERIDAEARATGLAYPEVFVARLLRARLDAARGDLGSAIERALAVDAEQRDWKTREGAVLPIAQMLSLEAVRLRGIDVALDVLRAYPETRHAWNRPVLDAIIGSRAGLLEAAGFRRAAHAGAGTGDSLRIRQRRAQARLRSWLYAVTTPPDSAQAAGELSSLRAELHDAEKALLRGVASDREENPQGGIASLHDVKSSLPEDAALLSFVRVRPPVATRFGPDRDLVTVKGAYVAFVLRPGVEVPALVDLGRAERLEAAIASWRLDANTNLRDVLWQPVAAELKDVKRIYVVPDGAVAGVSFDAIETSPGRFLADEELAFELLICERELAAPTRTRGENGSLLALGGPDHDASPGASQHDLLTSLGGVSSPEEAHSPAVQRGYLGPCTDFTTHEFPELPAAKLEVQEIVRQARKSGPMTTGIALVGRHATESALRDRAPQARGVHIAAHGFYIHPACDAGRSSGPVVPSRWLDGAPLDPGGDPLTRCGLALAGANRRAEAGPDEDDGLLTGDEIAALDLSGVEFVVLSACNSGVGEVLDGEGVLGLQRAFKIAGAGPVVMSLWPVEDQMARQWMRHFYAARLSEGVTTAEATRRASLAMLAERRRLGLSTRPSSWAPFVSVGVER